MSAILCNHYSTADSDHVAPLVKASLRVQRSNLAPIEAPRHERSIGRDCFVAQSAPRNDSANLH
jgi:hypothetical protein